MRLSDAGLRQRPTKALYPNHRSPPWLTEDATRDRSNRLLDYRAAPASKLPLNNADERTPCEPARKDSVIEPATPVERSLLNTALTVMCVR